MEFVSYWINTVSSNSIFIDRLRQITKHLSISDTLAKKRSRDSRRSSAPPYHDVWYCGCVCVRKV